MLQSNNFRARGFKFFSLGLVLILTGCFFVSEDKVEPGPNTTPGSTACADLGVSQQRIGDSLVAIAAGIQGHDLMFLFDTLSLQKNTMRIDSVPDSSGGYYYYYYSQSSFDSVAWNSARVRDYQHVLDLYNQALVAAPGHCGALFGRAIANLTLVIKEPALNAFILKANVDSQVPSAGALLKLSPDRAPPVLLKTTSSMQAMNKIMVQDVQYLLESAILPRVDLALADLDQVMKYQKFTFTYNFDANTVIFDHAILGPALGAFKVGKSFLLMVAGYDLDVSLNGSYDWMDTLGNIRNADFDNLRPGQTAALNQFTGLFRTTSAFTRQKPAYRAKLSGIPTLLLEAIQNAQDGLSYAITNHPVDCTYRLLCVGTAVTDDVDPVDAADMVDLLERSKKYMTGEVPVAYNRGRNTLRVNFKQVFSWDGMQNYLPYFQFNPYPEWNDVVRATRDTIWRSFYGGNDLADLSLPLMGYSQNDYDLYPSFDSTSLVNFLVYNPNQPSQYDTVATVMLTGTPCQVQYQKNYDRIYDSVMVSYNSVPNISSGTVLLPGCRDNGGYMEVVQFVDSSSVTKGPLYFTNPSGASTLTMYDSAWGGFNQITDLRGKIYFRDPTFGGVFPGLTNDNIWSTLLSLDSVQQRTEICVTDSIMPWMTNCTWRKPANPSDLDMFVWVMYRMDQYTRGLVNPGLPIILEPLPKL